ncbi:MAG: SGNH/GDSL hydrolase family protein, partial [Candidatus Omnitrophica bacterium]|nr:SGNH/GDSL hydrolase family protein [Candidatus Omnitrophota bacterium]
MVKILILSAVGIFAAFILLNVFIGFLFALRDRKRATTPFLVDDVQMGYLKTLMPDETDDDIVDILRCFSSSLYGGHKFRMVYAPYNEHKDSQFSSKFLNVSPLGFRLNSKDDNKDPFDEKMPHIATFGGSTAFGYGVKDADTMAAWLEKELQKKSEPYKVFNCGRQSYFSTGEIIAFQRFLQEGMRIRVVVFLDGINDVFHNCPKFRNRSRYSEYIEMFWNYIDYVYGYADMSGPKSGGRWVVKQLIHQIPVVRLLKGIRNRIAEELRAQDAKNMNMQFHEPWSLDCKAEDVNIKELAERISRLTLTNWDIVRGICRQFNIQPIFCFQPLPYGEMPPGKHLFKVENEHPLWESIYKEYYANMCKLSAGKDDFLDLSKVFKNAEVCPFIDSHHYSSYGNKLIAEAIIGH